MGDSRGLTPDVQNLPPPAMQLIEGYQHRRTPTLDTTRGVIWKEDGPRLDYDIDMDGPNQARSYFQTAETIWRRTMNVDGVSQDVVLG